MHYNVQTYALSEERWINPGVGIPNAKAWTFKQYSTRNSICEKRSISVLPI